MQQQGGMECRPEPLDLGPLTQPIIDIWKPIAGQKQIELVNTIAKGQWVKADAHMLETVVRNLVGNALKFTPRGGRVSLGILDPSGAHAQDFLTVVVKDTGVGMDAATVAKLFRIDVHHSTSGTDEEVGSGLGLIICKEMVERNGGTIWAESQTGKGTTLAFTVPRSAPC
jgi:signal transduction histidine kinase